MRARIVALMGVLLAACEVNPGVYFEVSGADIEFDELEFFLGKRAGTEIPFTPERPYAQSNEPSPFDERQRLFKRTFTGADIQQTEPTRNLTLYLPPDPENKLPTYLLVVAWRNGEVVALGEVEEFHVMGDAAYIYEVPLVPLAGGFERWGAPLDAASRIKGEDCVRWSRRRPGDVLVSSYAVVRDSDLDCDLMPAVADCDDLNFCADETGAICKTRETSCIDISSCNTGTCTDGTEATMGVKQCTPQTCFPDVMCEADSDCREETTEAGFLACAIELPTPHIEVTIPTMALGGLLCRETLDVRLPPGLSCLEPAIEWPPNGVLADDTVFFVDASSTQGLCVFTILLPDRTESPPDKSHLIVSVTDPMNPSLRTAFVIGFKPQSVPGFDCDNLPADVRYPEPVQLPPVCP